MSIFEKTVKKIGYYLLVFMLLAVIYGLVKSLLGYLNLDERFILAESEVEKLKQENHEFELTLYDVDKDFVQEKELRDSLGFSREGEVVVVLPEDLLERTIQERSEEKSDENDLANWEKWWSLFF